MCIPSADTLLKRHPPKRHPNHMPPIFSAVLFASRKVA
jgi:hypothetical protein